MTNKYVAPVLLAVALSGITSIASAATPWSEETHQLAFGDFDGDGKQDLLYIAKDPALPSGIARSDGTSPSINLQSWPSNHLGIPWHSGIYKAFVADFNGDNRADILMQRQTPGEHFLLLSNPGGTITAIAQTIPVSFPITNGESWSADAHRIVVGNFDGLGGADVFLQAVQPTGNNAVYLSSTTGTIFNNWKQRFGNSHMGLQWALNKAVVHAGDFDGDGKSDLFVQAKPDIAIIDYDISFPVPVYRKDSFGIANSKVENANHEIFYFPALQRWNRNDFGVDWAADRYEVVIGNFDGDGTNRADILLQSRVAGKPNQLMLAGGGGQFACCTSISAGSALANMTGDQYRLHAARFGASGAMGLYAQAKTESGTNQIVANAMTGASITHNPNLMNIVTPGTAVGAIPGSFMVDPNGGASYQIPISVPPGVAKIQPSLGIVYSSRVGNGALGVGWQLTGMSAITRCPTTVAQDGAGNQDGADFDTNDAFCLDGQRLIATSGSNGSVGAKYRTEIESFQDVTSSGGELGNPATFMVRDKNGLNKYYGTQVDSQNEDATFEARSGGTTGSVSVWALRRIQDRFDNFIEFRYEQEANSLEYRPVEIIYGSKFLSTKTVVGRVVFEYTPRNDSATGYIPGGYTASLTKRLQKISTFGRADPTIAGANDRVSQYYFNYEYSPVTALSHLTSVVLCDGGAGAVQRCWNSTRFQWQHGYRGFTSSSAASDVDLGSTVDLKMFDADGDGRSDYVYRHTSGNNEGQWLVRYASLVHTKGGGSYTQTGISVKQPTRAFSMDWNNDGYADLIDSTVNIGGNQGSAGNYRAWLGGPNGLSSSNYAQGPAAEGLTFAGLATTVGDFDGDGKQDIAYTPGGTNQSAYGSTLKVHLNNSTTPSNGLFGGQLISTEMGPGFQPARGTGLPWEFSFAVASAMDYADSTDFKDEPTVYPINFDGDGKDDILVRVRSCFIREKITGDAFENTCQPEFRVYSLVAGQLELVWFTSAGTASANGTFTAKHIKLGDYNGDGLTDVLAWGKGLSPGMGAGWHLDLGTGSKNLHGIAPFVMAMAASSLPNSSQCSDVDFQAFNIPLVGSIFEAVNCTLGSTIQLTEILLDSAMPFDYNRDGYTDLLVAGSGMWQVMPGGPNGYVNGFVNTGREARQAKRATLVDDAGDGLPDILFPWGSAAEDNWHVYYGRGPAVSGVIEKITDGLGAQTQVQYAVTTATTDQTNYVGTVYKGHTRFPEDPASATLSGFRTVQPLGWPNAHLAGAIPVVYQYMADNGLDAAGSAAGSVRTTLQYWGLKVNREGRGQLGFSEVRAWNDNSEIESRTRYAQQAFPYIGNVLTHEQRFRDQAVYSASLAAGPDGSSLYFDYASNCDTNYLCPQVTPQANTAYNENAAYTRVNFTTNLLGARVQPYGSTNVYQPYVRKKIDDVHPVSNGTPGASPFKRIVTEMLASSTSNADDESAAGTSAVDGWGNPGATRVKVTNGTSGGDTVSRDEHVTLTTGHYANEESTWCLSRLDSVTVTTTKPATNSVGNGHAPTSTSRTGTFGYGGGSQCVLTSETDASGLTTTYGYDTYGNVESVTISYPGMPSNEGRTTAFNFAATQGQFMTETRNSYDHAEQRTWDGRFGLVKSVTGPNGLTSVVGYDTFGRKVKETPISALPSAYSETAFYWCANTNMCLDGRGTYIARTFASDGSLGLTEFDRVGRAVSTRKTGFDGGWVASEAYFDPLGRAYLTSRPYKLATQTTRCWDHKSYDALGRVTSTWSSYATSECTSSVPAFNAALSGGRQTQTVYDLITAEGNTTKITGNASDTSSYATARVGYSTVNVVGRTRYVRDELSPGGCPSNGGSISANSTTCLQTEYDYNAQGNLTYTKQVGGLGVTTATPATTLETKATFDDFGRQRQLVDPDMGTWNYTYTPFGELDTQTDAKGQVTDIDYDRLGRVKYRVEKLNGGAAETSTTFAYDTAPMGKGKIASVTSSNGFTEWTSYDSLGRFAQLKRQLDGAYYYLDQSYDGLGRPDVLKYPGSVSGDTSSGAESDSNRVRVRNNYNGYGFLASVQDVALGTTYWRADNVDEIGNVTQETLGNGRITKRSIDRVTGYIGAIKTGSAGNEVETQNLEFGFDQAANLRIRKDLTTGVNGGNGIREEYGYDKLYRLKQMTQFKPASSAGPAVSIENYTYDDFGNLLSKGTSYTDYCYVARGGANDPCAGITAQRPHAAKRLKLGAGTSRDFGFDANGNVTSATNAMYDGVTWNVANLPKRVSKGAKYSEFTYGADRARFKQYLYRASNDTETTIYFGGLYEKVTKLSGASTTVEHTHYIMVGDKAITLAKRTGTGAIWLRYPHRDQLGSIVALTNESGALLERSAFDPWGKRTSYSTWDAIAPGTYSAGGTGAGGLVAGIQSTKRGYTSHEHVEELGFVHMNGRIYDNEAGRFFSADPHIQFPLSTQGFNRYSYVGNNPLSYTDPSGYYVDKGALGELLIAVGKILSEFGGWFKVVGYLLIAVGGWLKSGGTTEGWLNWMANNALTFEFTFSGASPSFSGQTGSGQSKLGNIPVLYANGNSDDGGSGEARTLGDLDWEWATRTLEIMAAGTGPLSKYGPDGKLKNWAVRQKAAEQFDALEQTLRRRRDADPKGVIPLSREEFNTLLLGQYYEVVDQPIYDNLFGESNETSIKGHFAGGVADTFLWVGRWSGRVFHVEGIGDVEAGHLNYIGVGMLAAHYGYGKATMYGLVVAHNVEDMITKKTWRDLKDINPGARFADMAIDFYNGQKWLEETERLRNDPCRPR